VKYQVVATISQVPAVTNSLACISQGGSGFQHRLSSNIKYLSFILKPENTAGVRLVGHAIVEKQLNSCDDGSPHLCIGSVMVERTLA
jgi:hypothetical protein